MPPRTHHRRNDRAPRFVMASTLSGILILAIGIGITIFFHQGKDTEPYSPLNHFVSELGWRSHSPKAAVFNTATIIGSLLFIPLVVYLGLVLRGRLGHLAAIFGVCSVLAGGAVGIIPMDNLIPHLVAAILYFTGWLAAVSLFTLAFWQKRKSIHSATIATAGVISIAAFLLFLVYPKESVLPILYAIMHHQKFERPEIWTVAILEWAAVGSSLLWALAATNGIRQNFQNNPDASRQPFLKTEEDSDPFH